MEDASATRERQLAERILGVIGVGPDGDAAAFDLLAAEVFAYQYERNEPYRLFCGALGVNPAVVSTWRDIPAYPTDAFKSEVVASFPVDEAVHALMTSGTTSPNQRGRIFRDELGKELVFTANRVMTGAYLFPDFAEGTRCRILLLVPSLEIAPTMGMAIGLDQTRRHFGTDDSMFLVGRTGVDIKALVGALREAEETGVPVALIGATSAYVYFFNACRARGVRFSLPAGSRVCDGGGYRGRFGVVTRDDYYGLVADILGVPASHCVNTLGMGETATNYFDDTLRNHVLGRTGSRRKVSPPWTRTVVVDAETREELPPGRPGLLRHYDIANLPTVLGVQSDNLGIMLDDGGFEIIGRAKVVDGKVMELPSERTVGPMGDTPVFRLLEAYVNFSIDFKMGRIASSAPKSSWLEIRREQETAAGGRPEDVVDSCPAVVEEMVAAGDDPEAALRAEASIRAFGGRSDGAIDDPECSR